MHKLALSAAVALLAWSVVLATTGPTPKTRATIEDRSNDRSAYQPAAWSESPIDVRRAKDYHLGRIGSDRFDDGIEIRGGCFKTLDDAQKNTRSACSRSAWGRGSVRRAFAWLFRPFRRRR